MYAESTAVSFAFLPQSIYYVTPFSVAGQTRESGKGGSDVSPSPRAQSISRKKIRVAAMATNLVIVNWHCHLPDWTVMPFIGGVRGGVGVRGYLI